MLMVHILAQAAAAAAPEAAVAPASQGVISYPATFFAAQQPSNAAEMVQRVPGFSIDNGSSVRGFEGAAGNVLIDGQRPSTKTESVEDILRRMPASQVERIDLIRGGAPGIDMQGKTVLANVIRKKGGGFRGLIAGSQNHTSDGRTAGAARAEASGGSGERKWEVASLIGKGIDDGAGDGPGVRIPGDGSPVMHSFARSEGDGLNGFVSGAYETPLAGGKARVNTRAAWDKFKFEEDNAFLPPDEGVERTDDVYKTRDTEVGGNFTRPFGDKTTLEVVGLRQTRDRTITSHFVDVDESESDFALNRESSETIGRAVVKYRWDDRLSFEGGGETALNKLDSHTAFSADGQPVDLPAANVQVEELRGEVFLKGAWRPTDRGTVDAGLRYETSTVSSDGDVVLEKTLRFLKPRAAVTWSPVTRTQLRLRIEREVGQLNFSDFVASSNLNSGAGVSAGNPDLDPEQAWVAEAALEQRFWASGVIVVTYTHREITDVVDRGPVFVDDAVFDRPTNIGDGTRDDLGVELTLPLDKLGLKGAQLKGDVTRHWSQVTDPTTGEEREISGLHPIDWNASFVHDLPQWRLSYGVDAYGGWRETYYRFNLIQTIKLRTYVKPFVEWRPASDVSIRMELPNVTARGLRRTVAIYDGPRNASGAPTIDDREYQNGRMLYFRVRKTFG